MNLRPSLAVNAVSGSFTDQRNLLGSRSHLISTSIYTKLMSYFTAIGLFHKNSMSLLLIVLRITISQKCQKISYELVQDALDCLIIDRQFMI
jgi:hypothetical protein